MAYDPVLAQLDHHLDGQCRDEWRAECRALEDEIRELTGPLPSSSGFARDLRDAAGNVQLLELLRAEALEMAR